MNTLMKDWSKFDANNPEHRKALMRNLRFNISLYDTFQSKEFSNPENSLNESYKKLREKISEARSLYVKEFMTTGDFPVSPIEAVAKFRALVNWDNGYEQIYDVLDFTNATTEGFSLDSAEDFVVFEKKEIGEKIEFRQARGSQVFVFFKFYGGGLNWHRSLFDDQQFWKIEDNARAFVNKAFSKRAQDHYDLLEAAMDQKTCATLEDLNCTSCDEFYRAVAKALNDAAVTIMENTKNKGLGNTANTRLIILAPLQQWDTVRKALGVKLQSFDSSVNETGFNFGTVTTMMLTNKNRIGIFLPGNRIKAGYRMDLTTFTSFDMATYADAQAGWMRYGSIVGDLDQVECIDLSNIPSGLGGI